MAVERTLSIVKPDAVAKNAIGQIYSRFEQAGLNIVAARMRYLSQRGAICRKGRPKASTPCTASARFSAIW